MKRWSSLQRELYLLIDDKLDFQIHVNKYRMGSGSTCLPRYWITFRGEIIFDYPKQFMEQTQDGCFARNLAGEQAFYPYQNDVTDISDLFRAYIDTPKEELFTKHFEDDHWGLINILKAADRRIGKRRLEILRKRVKNKAAIKIIEYRLHEDGMNLSQTEQGGNV